MRVKCFAQGNNGSLWWGFKSDRLWLKTIVPYHPKELWLWCFHFKKGKDIKICLPYTLFIMIHVLITFIFTKDSTEFWTRDVQKVFAARSVCLFTCQTCVCEPHDRVMLSSAFFANQIQLSCPWIVEEALLSSFDWKTQQEKTTIYVI